MERLAQRVVEGRMYVHKTGQMGAVDSDSDSETLNACLTRWTDASLPTFQAGAMQRSNGWPGGDKISGEAPGERMSSRRCSNRQG